MRGMLHFRQDYGIWSKSMNISPGMGKSMSKSNI